MGLRIVPLTLKQANAFIQTHHRHHKRVVGHRFSLGCVDDTATLVGVAVVGRPVCRNSPQYHLAEVTRLATNGHRNACSKLYTACARVASEMGFEKIQTYVLQSEPGTSLKASGWQFEAVTKGGDWNRGRRKGRRTDQPMEPKQRWGKQLRQTRREAA